MPRTIEELFDDLIHLMSIKRGNPTLLIHKLRQIRAAEATFKTIEADTGDATAETSDDTFTIAGGDNVSTSITDTTLTINIGLFMEYKGTLNASEGSYPTSPEKGDYWVISVAGTINGTVYAITDWCVYNGSSWDKIDNTQAIVISDDAYAASWNGVTTIGASKNALYDQIDSMGTIIGALIEDDAFAIGWNGDTSHAASKNALYDQINAMNTTIGNIAVFQTISCPAGSNPVADVQADTLTITATGDITITGDVIGDTIDFSVTKYTNIEAVAAVVAENPLALTNSLKIGGNDILDNGDNIILSSSGAGVIDVFAQLSCNITFSGAQTVDGIDISAISLSNQPAAASGNIDCGTQAITNVGNVNGVDVSGLSTTVGALVEDEAFGIAWNGDTSHAASKDNLYDYISAINITNMPAAVNNWKMYCTNGSGIMTEIATGAAATLLTGAGVGAAPSFQAPAPGGGWTVVDAVADIQPALDAGGGIFLMAGTYVLTATLDIDQNKSVVIQGEGDETIIDCAANRTAFNITVADSVVLRDFKIDTADVGGATEVVVINEASDNPVTIDNVSIIGDGDKLGVGITTDSDNVTIRNCTISSLLGGIGIDSLYCKVHNNIAKNNAMGGISLSTSSAQCTISNNICTGNGGTMGGYGISIIGSNYNTLIGNICDGNNCDIASPQGGIIIDSNSDNNTINGNSCNNNNNANIGGDSYGIIINNATCDNNTVMGNTALGNDTNYQDLGTNTFDTDGAGQSLNNIV